MSASTVMMVRPARFGANPECAGSNAFQGTTADLPPARRQAAAVQAAAAAEFDGLVAALDRAGVRVCAYDDTLEPATPDACFPNNWVSFHADGRVVLYPMLAPSRRAEVRPDLVARLERDLGWAWPTVVDLTPLAERGAFLEGTGSLVLDRGERVAYAALSPRTTAAGLEAFAEALGYAVIPFRAVDPGGQAVYHTNVCMGLGPGFAAIALEWIPDPAERRTVRRRLEQAGREVIPLGTDQVRGFAGNLLGLWAGDGQGRIVLSERALGSLESGQRAALERHGDLVWAPLNTIETLGGGSARCMLAEVVGPA